MKKSIVFLCLSLLLCQQMFAQTTQPGRVLEYNGKTQKTPLKRAVQINVQGAGSTVSDATTGNFNLSFTNIKGGQLNFVSKPRAMGYELMNTREVDAWNINPNRIFNLVFCNKTQFDQLCMKYYDISMKSYDEKLKKSKELLEKALKANEIQQEEYDAKLKQLEEDYTSKIANIDTYVDQFARIDLSEVSEKEQQILALVDEGEIDKAIAEYEKLDATSKLMEVSQNIQKLNDANAKIQEELNIQTAERDSVLAVFHREIDLLKMAGGEENLARVGKMLEAYVDCDTTNVDAFWEWATFLGEQDDLQNKWNLLFVIEDLYKKAEDKIGLFKTRINFVSTCTDWGYNEQAQEDIEIADKLYQELIDNSIEIPFLLRIEYYVTKSDFLFAIKEHEAANECSKIVFNLCEQEYKNNPSIFEHYSRAYNDLSSYLDYSGDMEQALQYQLKSLQILDSHKDLWTDITKAYYVSSKYNLGVHYINREKYDEALNIFLECNKTFEYLYKKNPIRFLIYYANCFISISTCYNLLNDNENAIVSIGKAIDLLEIGMMKNKLMYTFDCACAHETNGIYKFQDGDYNGALKSWNRILEILPTYVEDQESATSEKPELYLVLKQKGLIE